MRAASAVPAGPVGNHVHRTRRSSASARDSSARTHERAELQLLRHTCTGVHDLRRGVRRAQVCAQESEGRAKSESAKERESITPRTRARAHTHMRTRILARAHGLNSRKDTRARTQDCESRHPDQGSQAVLSSKPSKRVDQGLRSVERRAHTPCVACVLARAAAPATAVVFVAVGTLSVVGRAVGVDVGARGHAHCIVARAAVLTFRRRTETAAAPLAWCARAARTRSRRAAPTRRPRQVTLYRVCATALMSGKSASSIESSATT